MRRMWTHVLTGAVVAVFASLAFAEDAAPATAAAKPAAQPAHRSVFQKMDRNRDGKVTTEEHQVRLKEWLKELDKNGDGKLTPDEYVGIRFAETDVNRDGSITLDDFIVFFIGKDALSQAEKTALSETLYSKDAQAITGVEVVAFRKSVFKAMNASGSGKVTPEELNAYTAREFEFLDKDKDGLVTEEEILAVAVMPVFAAPAAPEKK